MLYPCATLAVTDRVLRPLSQILLDLVQSPNSSHLLHPSDPGSSSLGTMPGMFKPRSIPINGELATPANQITVSHLAESMTHWLDEGSVGGSTGDSMESRPASMHEGTHKGMAMHAEFQSHHMILFDFSFNTH